MSLGALAATGAAGPSISLTPVPTANAKTAGMSRPNVLSPELQDVTWAQGSTPVENPSNGISYYGYDDGGTFLPVPGSFTAGPPASVSISQVAPIEATKTEPDKNTYLVLDNVKGADPNYDYGRHFLFQGHENGSPGYITRINLDADGPHRVTLLATKDSNRREPAGLRRLDVGSVGEAPALHVRGATTGGVWQATLDVPSKVDNLRPTSAPAATRGSRTTTAASSTSSRTSAARRTPTQGRSRSNSFVYRFKPKDPADLTQGGTIQALQVLGTDGQPITSADGNLTYGDNPPKYAALHLVRQLVQDEVGRPDDDDGCVHAAGPGRQRAARRRGRDAVQATRERRLPAGLEVQEVLLHRDGRHRQPHDAPRRRVASDRSSR